MSFIEAFKIALTSILDNKMRSILTMLGLIIGISSVVTIVSLGNGTQSAMKENFESLGINRISISQSRRATLTPKEQLTSSDMELLKNYFPDEIDTITPRLTQSSTVLENIDDTGVSLVGVSSDSFETLNLEMLTGRFVNDFDIDSRNKRIVIPSDLATEIFGSTDCLGEKIFLRTEKTSTAFQIIGVYESTETLSGYSTPSIYISYTTVNDLYNLGDKISGIQIGINENYDQDTVADEILSLLERRHGNEGENKYSVFNAEEQMEMVTETLNTVTLFISAIAAISLVVGGIGIMNIMLVSVTERTREIGIRKALGARKKDILSQFLIESVTISIFGGILGALFGMIFTEIASTVMDMNTKLSLNSLFISIIFSSSIGIFFGIYPANKASKLDPIVALRYE